MRTETPECRTSRLHRAFAYRAVPYPRVDCPRRERLAVAGRGAERPVHGAHAVDASDAPRTSPYASAGSHVPAKCPGAAAASASRASGAGARRAHARRPPGGRSRARTTCRVRSPRPARRLRRCAGAARARPCAPRSGTRRAFTFFARSASRYDSSGSARSSSVPWTNSTCRPTSCLTGSSSGSSAQRRGRAVREPGRERQHGGDHGCPAARSAARGAHAVPTRHTGTSP